MRHGHSHERHTRACGTHPRARRWMSTDCCGWFCACLTWIFLAIGAVIVYVALLRDWKGDPFSEDPERRPDFWGWFHYVGFYGCVVLAYWSHLKTMLTDPGAIPLEAVPLDYYNYPPYTGAFQDFHQICRECGTFKPRIAHHCRVCERCVVRMDHHCIWSNNCIGQTNHKFFILFCLYIFMSCLWAMYLIFMSIIACARGYREDSEGRYYQSLDWCKNSPVMNSLYIVLLGIESLFFGMFTMCMLCDQGSMLNQGMSQIDKLKAIKNKETYQVETFKDSLAHIFGGDGSFSVWWFVPIDAKWKNPEKEFHFMLPRATDALHHRLDASSLTDDQNGSDKTEKEAAGHLV